MRRVLAAWTALVAAALYAPAAVTAVFSLNASKHFRWTGFSTEWYARLASNRDLGDALANSLALALASTSIGTVLGTLAALGTRGRFPGRRLFQGLLALPVMVPDIVLAVALLSLLRAAGAGLSLATAACAQATYTLAYVAVVVSARLRSLDPSLEAAAQDLGATPAQAFLRVTLPAIRPGIVAGALLAFTLAFDDFVVVYFTNGPERATLPVLVYSMIRFGVTPEVHALSTILLAVSLALVLLSLKISKVPLTGGAR